QPSQAQTAPSTAQRQNQPATAQRTPSQREQREQGMTGSSMQPIQAQDAPSAAQTQNQPAPAQRNLSRRERREQGMTGSSTQPNQAQNAPAAAQTQNQPAPAQRNLSQRGPSQREKFEQGFAGSTGAPLASGRNGAAGGVVNTTLPIPAERRAELTQRFAGTNLHRTDRVGFSLTVGAVVPRGARLYPLPADIVSVYPAFRGYEYIAVADRVAIVEPRTMKIVTIIEERGLRQGFVGSAAAPRGAIVIRDRERVLIRDRLHRVALHRAHHTGFALVVG